MAGTTRVAVSIRIVGAIVLGAATVTVFVFASSVHEFWRDELQAALIARAVPLVDLVPEMRTEAVPPVLFLVLKALRWLPVPYSLSAFAPLGYASLLFGTYRLLLTLSRSQTRSLAATAALALTDTYFYELGIVVRQYGLGLGCALACVGYLGNALRGGSRRDARWGALFGAVAASTAVHPGCLAGAALLSYSGLRLARRPTLRAVIEPVCALPAFLFTFFLIGPYDRAPEAVAEHHEPLVDAAERAGRVIADGLVCRGWWSDWTQVYAIGAPRLVAMVSVVLALIGLVVLRRAELRRAKAQTAFYALTLSVNAAALLYIFVVRYQAFHRHHLFLFMPAFLVGLGALLGRAPARERRGPERLAAAGIAILFAPWFLFQYFTCAADVAGDYREAFGSAEGAAAVFPRDARVVIAGDDWMAAGIVYYRPDVALRATTSLGRPIHYMIADWHWHDEVPLLPLLAEECRMASPAPIYVLARGDAPDAVALCTRFVAAPPAHLATERFRVYELACGCPAVAAGP